jgi:hypothetical protein
MTDFDLSRINWRKSRRSGGNGGNCVEIAPAWRKSSYSGENGGPGVEVASLERVITVRDSKNPGGPVLTFSPHIWRAFMDGVLAQVPPGMDSRP